VTVWFLAVETTDRADLIVERARQRVVLERTELRQTVGELSNRLVSAVSLDDVVRTYTSIVADRYQVSVLWLGRYDSGLDRFRVVSDTLPDTVSDEIATWTSSTPAPGPVAMKLGTPIWVSDREELVRQPESTV